MKKTQQSVFISSRTINCQMASHPIPGRLEFALRMRGFLKLFASGVPQPQPSLVTAPSLTEGTNDSRLSKLISRIDRQLSDKTVMFSQSVNTLQLNHKYYADWDRATD